MASAFGPSSKNVAMTDGGNNSYKQTSTKAATNAEKANKAMATAAVAKVTANKVDDPNKGKDPDSGKGGGYYGGGGGGGGGSSAPAAKDWASAIASNADAMNQYLNPNGTAQYDALMKEMEGSPSDYLKGTEGVIPTTEESMQAADDMMATAGIGGKDYFEGAGIDGDVNIDRLDHINFDEEKALLDQIAETQKQQAILNTDNTVNKSITDIQRALEDSQDQYQTQRDQIEAEEARARDNQALYADARGDRGGIGAAQYDTIANDAAARKFNVQKEQVKVAQDAQRQITSLRAQGEFEKANQLLQITQQNLSELMNLNVKAKEMNLGIDEFNTQLAQWEENYRMQLLDAELNVSNMRLNTFSTLQNAALNVLNSQLNLANASQNAKLNNLNAQLNVANALGSFGDGTPTYQARLNAIEQLASSGNALMQAGVAPTKEQLAAMGLTQDQAVAYLKKYYPNG